LKHKILNYLERALEEWKIPTLFVSHGQAEVRRFSEWVIVINQGKIVSQGYPQEALGTPYSLQWKNSTAPENLLKIDDFQCGESYCIGRVGNQFLKLPMIPNHFAPPIFVEFSPNSVILSKRDIPDISARNHLKGIVQQIIQLKNDSFLAVDVGQILWAEITNEALKELEIEVGSELYCLIKTHSLKIFD
jgi:molybdate transport system ATP-binding protein